MLTIRGARVVTPGKDLGVTTFSVDGGRIAAVGGVCSSVNCADGCRTPFVGATCLGVHLEGPFFNASMAGAQNPAYLKKPDAAMVKRLDAISKVVKVSLAPELEGAEDCIRELVAAGIVVSGGHSAAEKTSGLTPTQAGRIALVRREFDYLRSTVAVLHHYHSYLMARGLIADPLDPLYGSFDVSWNAKWTYRSERKGDTWFSLVTLPFASLGTEAPKAGEKWQFNLGRLAEPDGSRGTAGFSKMELSLWSPNFENRLFFNPDALGAIVFE